jgi:SH3-like domain-containing protein
VEEYATWHLSRVGTESYRENIRKAPDIALETVLILHKSAMKAQISLSAKEWRKVWHADLSLIPEPG